MAVASLVLGIIATVLAVIGFGWVAAIIGIVGVILGAIARKNNPGNGMATAGLVLSIIGTVLALLVYIACAACIGSLAMM